MSKSSNGGFLFKTGLFALIAGALYYFFNQSPSENTPPKEEPITSISEPIDNFPDYIPSGRNGEIVQHTYFALGYNETHEQANWVAYEVTRDRLNANFATRPNSFRSDPTVTTGSAEYHDYSGSGFDRGHLCAAADMAFSEKAIDETFYMSNISPQDHYFNIGIWRELEELTRDWGRKYGDLQVVTGPVLADKNLKQIGKSEVSVPKRFYKAIHADGRAIAFVMPNERSDNNVMEYAMSIDDLESLTGFDFFPKLLNGQRESLEAAYRPDDWPVDTRRFLQRVEVWNQVGRE